MSTDKPQTIKQRANAAALLNVVMTFEPQFNMGSWLDPPPARTSSPLSCPSTPAWSWTAEPRCARLAGAPSWTAGS